MNWNDYVEEAKTELGYSPGEWIDNFHEVIELAKTNYWEGEDFKNLKEETIEDGANECLICCSSKRLTAHHITYGSNSKTICVCKECHGLIHEVQKKWGFVMQCVLTYWDDWKTIYSEFPGIYSSCVRCNDELIAKVNEVENETD